MPTIHAISRFLAPPVLAAALGLGFAVPATPAQAQDDLTRMLVDIADVVFRAGVPYYRHGNYGQYDRLVVQRDRYGRPVYYRYVPQLVAIHRGPYPGDRSHGPDRYYRDVDCNRHGKCKVTYYDPRYDRDHRHRWHDDDDD